MQVDQLLSPRAADEGRFKERFEKRAGMDGDHKVILQHSFSGKPLRPRQDEVSGCEGAETFSVEGLSHVVLFGMHLKRGLQLGALGAESHFGRSARGESSSWQPAVSSDPPFSTFNLPHVSFFSPRWFIFGNNRIPNESSRVT